MQYEIEIKSLHSVLQRIIIIMVLYLFTFTCLEQTILLELDSEVELLEDCPNADNGEEEGVDDVDDVFNIYVHQTNETKHVFVESHHRKNMLLAFNRSDHSFEVPYPPPEAIV